ncbi:selenium cofactor biosynthesis protein YqeC, partial [Anaerotruncus massiliensis (ex Togo et al. 2019)]
PETLAWLAAHTDALFLEADGSRRLPVKFPNSTEPVIPEGTGRVIAVAGLSALGRPVDEVCHRAPLAREALGIPEGASVTPGIIARLLLAGYGRFSPTVLLNQADTPALREQGEQAAALLRAGGIEKVLILSLRQEAEITC